MNKSPLWALTTYFNPMRYQRRLQNYRMFRKELRAPLVAVEVSYTDTFDLKNGDADVLVQLRADSVLWQKERLLNVALKNLPSDVPFAAWLDCDLIFSNPNWAEATADALQSVPVAQPFSAVFDLPRDVSPSMIDLTKTAPSSLSMGRKLAINQWADSDFRPATQLTRSGLGFGWAARRDLLDKHQLYDAMIIGSGDRMITYGACGKFSDAIEITRLNKHQREHYLSWAQPFHDAVMGRIGYADGIIYHLWHGDLKDRRYRERHEELQKFDFDPFVDIGLDKQQCWTWTTQKIALIDYVKEYFSGRNEDGGE